MAGAAGFSLQHLFFITEMCKISLGNESIPAGGTNIPAGGTNIPAGTLKADQRAWPDIQALPEKADKDAHFWMIV